MIERTVILYIAMSLDGYIARVDNTIDWLSVVEQQGEDYGYSDFVGSVDTVIMGRKTYEKVLTFGGEFPHKGRMCYVLSRTQSGTNEHVTFFNGAAADLVRKLKQKGGANIFVDGGADVVNSLMTVNLIDKFVLSVIPVFLGSGIPLFQSGRPEQLLKLTNSFTFPSGLVQLWYEKKA